MLCFEHIGFYYLRSVVSVKTKTFFSILGYVKLDTIICLFGSDFLELHINDYYYLS
jgi:hypothetical protein